MRTVMFADADGFLARARPWLLADEVVNGLMLGIAASLQRGPTRRRKRPFLATVENDAEEIVAAAVMTPPRKLVVTGSAETAVPAMSALVETLTAASRQVPAVLGPAPLADAFVQQWTAVSGETAVDGPRQRVFALHRVHPYTPPPGTLRPAGADDLDLIAEWIFGFQSETNTNDTDTVAQQIAGQLIQNGDIFVWDHDGPVSMAARSRPSENGIAVNLVYTPPAQRGKGYATACVGALSRRLLDEGWRFCTLFTDLANPTSNHIYEKLGYRPVADFHEYRFRSP